MAFRLRPRESVAKGLRRLARKELQSAREELRKTSPPRDDAIREARKSLKKVRAVVALIEADGGRGLAGCRKRLRRVNDTLSRLRDAGAMIEILTKLRNKHPGVLDEHTFARVRHRLSSQKRESTKAARDSGAWKRIDRELRKLRRAAKRWRPAHRGFAALETGFHVTYRRGHKALARARTHQRADDFHEWRKQIKALWYQLRLVEECHSDIRRDARALHQAETWLGDEHNVVVLCAELSKDASLCDVERLRHTANRYQCELRQKTIAGTARIYRRKPGQYRRHIKRVWKDWQRHSSARTQDPRRAAA